jgi:hypothetical protein
MASRNSAIRRTSKLQAPAPKVFGVQKLQIPSPNHLVRAVPKSIRRLMSRRLLLDHKQCRNLQSRELYLDEEISAFTPGCEWDRFVAAIIC